MGYQEQEVGFGEVPSRFRETLPPEWGDHRIDRPKALRGRHLPHLIVSFRDRAGPQTALCLLFIYGYLYLKTLKP